MWLCRTPGGYNQTPMWLCGTPRRLQPNSHVAVWPPRAARTRTRTHTYTHAHTCARAHTRIHIQRERDWHRHRHTRMHRIHTPQRAHVPAWACVTLGSTFLNREESIKSVSITFITQLTLVRSRKAIFSPKVFVLYPIIFVFILIFLKKLGTKKPLVYSNYR